MLTDGEQMARALALAERGRGQTSPNPIVGAVVVDSEGVVVGRGAHRAAGGPHAEVFALDDAGERARGATLYCTLEPCCHTGRTGPCAPRVVASGIRRAVVAIEDPNPLVAGRGIAHLRRAGLDVTVGVMREAAERANRPFFTRMRNQRPFVTLKAALSLDARVAAGPGVRTHLTGPASDRLVHRERAEVDAIAVGSETVLADDPLLTPRGAYRARPLARVVFDRRLRTPPGARLLSTRQAGPVTIFCTEASLGAFPERARALTEAGAHVEGVAVEGTEGTAFLQASLRRLAGAGLSSLVVEGGPTLHEAFWNANLVDRIQLFVVPRALGPQGLTWMSLPPGTLAGLSESSASPIGDDVMIEGYVHRTD